MINKKIVTIIQNNVVKEVQSQEVQDISGGKLILPNLEYYQSSHIFCETSGPGRRHSLRGGRRRVSLRHGPAGHLGQEREGQRHDGQPGRRDQLETQVLMPGFFSAGAD